MTPIKAVSGCPASVPADRAEMKITLDWLKEKQACQDGQDKFSAAFPEGCSYSLLREKIAEEKSVE